MFLLFVAFLLPLALCCYLMYRLKFARMIEVTKDWASPPSLPLVGHGHYFINSDPADNFKTFRGFIEEYGGNMKIWLGPDLNLIFGEARDVEAVLGTTRLNDKAGEYTYLKNWLREGLLISGGKKWHQRRKILTPAFHFKILEQFIEIFEHESRILVCSLQREMQMQPSHGFALYDLVNLCTLDTICESAMGVSVNAQTNTDSEYVRAVKTISTVLHKRMFDIFYRFELTYKFTKLAREEKRALAVLHGFTEKVIVQRREELLREQENAAKAAKGRAGQAGGAVNGDDDEAVGAKRKLAFLDILLQSEIDGKPLSNLDIREEVDTFMFEGHDTTSSAITFFFYNIATHPECQQKCVDEIVAIFGKDTRAPVTYENLNRMHYIELCIKETLRMFPSVPLLGRKVTHECEINGKIIPAGTNIGISPLYLGRNVEIFPQPDEFRPERFDVVYSSEKMNPFAFIPFSAGPRNCIGQKFAMLEIKAIVANVLRHFVVEFAGNPREELQLIGELILRTKDPLMFRLKSRVL